MLKSFTIAILIFIISLQTSYTQPWHYDFGTGEGNFITSGIDSSLLPMHPSGFYKIRIGTGLGGFYLVNSTFPFSSDSYLKISAPNNATVNKYALYDYTPGKSFTLKFKVRFGAFDGSDTATSGTWFLFIGDGTSFSGNSGFTGSHSFAGLKFVFGTASTITTTYRVGSSWINTGITGTPFTQGQNYIVEIYGNNTISSQNYTYSNSETVAANKWDLWINGMLVGDDLAKGLLGNNAFIDSYMFYAESSVGNTANIFLDDIDYHNDVAGTPLPVTLTSFNVTGTQRNAILMWSTSSEINNAGFEIERSSTSASGVTTWNKTAFVQGYGTTNEPMSYIYEDKNLSAGKYSYRLKQIDFNGNYEYFNPSGNSVIDITKPAEFTLSQNYPNPSNPVSKIDYHLPFDGFVNITVYDITGKAVKQLINTSLTADYYTLIFDGSDLSSGIYFYRITVSSGNETFTKTMKMLLIK